MCKKEEVPMLIMSGAARMIAHLPKTYYQSTKLCIASIACIRLSYKWVYDRVSNRRLKRLDTYIIGLSSELDWLHHEASVMKALDWSLMPYFSSASPTNNNNEETSDSCTIPNDSSPLVTLRPTRSKPAAPVKPVAKKGRSFLKIRQDLPTRKSPPINIIVNTSSASKPIPTPSLPIKRTITYENLRMIEPVDMPSLIPDRKSKKVRNKYVK